MKLFLSTVLILCVGMMGCAVHYYRIKDNTLYFYLKKPDAHRVEFAHSTDGFTLHRAQKIDARTWQIQVSADVEFTYFYLVDGKLFLPPGPPREKDDFGSENCIFVPQL